MLSRKYSPKRVKSHNKKYPSFATMVISVLFVFVENQEASTYLYGGTDERAGSQDDLAHVSGGVIVADEHHPPARQDRVVDAHDALLRATGAGTGIIVSFGTDGTTRSKERKSPHIRQITI